MALVLAADYYLKNFEHVLGVVRGSAANVLSAAERRAFDRFEALAPPARQLFVRLLGRKGPTFVASRIVYPEIADVPSAIDRLVDTGLFALAPDGDGDRSVSIPDRAPFDLLPLLYFGNRRQSMADIVLAEIQRVVYPTYDVSRVPLFESRSALDAYLEAIVLADTGAGGLDAGVLRDRAHDTCDRLATWTLPPPHRRHLDPGRYLARFALGAAHTLERRRPEEAFAILERLVGLGPVAARVDAADRLGMLARRLRRPYRFLGSIQELATRADLHASASFRIQRRVAILRRTKSPAAALRSAPEIALTLRGAGMRRSKALYASRASEPVTIEEAVLDALCERWHAGGALAENSLYLTLFGLLFWDVVFAPVPGAFQHRFQRGPVDLASAAFFESRAALVRDRLAALEGLDLPAELRRSWDLHDGIAAALVSFHAWNREVLARAAAALGGALLPILEHIARDPGHHGKGLPDLLLWSNRGPTLVEVKGPGDQLRLEQRLWHDKLIELGLDVRVARVSRLP